ncbi:MAG: GtrA family protein [Acidimicrobiales bacterium]
MVPRLLAAPLVRKLAKYASVSVISTVVSLSILGTLIATRATTAGWANVLATGVATIPSFELNRRWVWAKAGRRSIWAEVGPFVTWCFAELGLSTLAVSAAARWADHSHLGTGARTFVALAANVLTFGTLWLAQFWILDRILFRHRAPVAVEGSGNGP